MAGETPVSTASAPAEAGYLERLRLEIQPVHSGRDRNVPRRDDRGII